MSARLQTGAALLGIVVIMAIGVPDGPLAVDQRWADAMTDIRSSFLTHVALFFDWLGHGVGWTLTVGSIALVLALTRRGLALIVFALAEGLSWLSSGVLKALVARPRPPNGLVHPIGSSFPSGHTAFAAVTSVAVVLLFTRRRPWWAAAALATAAMAWSRTYLHAHWLSDVVGGAALGVGVALVTFALAQRPRSIKS